MAELSLEGVAIVAAVAFGAPLLLGLVPQLRLPAIALELTAGILLGPQVLGWVEVDEPLRVLSLIGLAFLLFLAGLELDLERLRGNVLRLATAGFVVSLVLGLLAGWALKGADLVRSPLLIAIAFTATGIGVIIPVLKDAGHVTTDVGRITIAGASIAEVMSIVLLSIFFSEESGGLGSRLVLFGGFVLLGAAVMATVFELEHSKRLGAAMVRLQDTTAQIRVRGAFVLLIIFAALASRFGVEAILGAFAAGALIGVVDRHPELTHPHFRLKLEAAGYGVFVPFFFIVSGVRLDIEALFASGSAIARVPLFLAILLVVRGVPALLYRRYLGARETVASGLLQATSVSFLVVAGTLGLELGLISTEAYAALITAGLLSVLVFPVVALALLRPREPAVLGAR